MNYLSNLNGALGILASTLILSCVGNETAADSGTTDKNLLKTPNGAALFDKNCKICHGSDGRLGLNGAKDLSQSQLALPERINIITSGKNLMTPFSNVLSAAEIEAVAIYSQNLNPALQHESK